MPAPQAINKVTRLFKNPNTGRWMWEETVIREVDEVELRTDLVGAENELEYIQLRIKQFQDQLPTLTNDVDIIGAKGEIESLRLRSEELKIKIRNINNALSAIHGNDPGRSGDTPNRLKG